MNGIESVARDRVSVSREGTVWRVRGQHAEIRLDEATLAVTLAAKGCTWALRPPAPDDLTIETGGACSTHSLLAAARRRVSPYHTGARAGIKIELDGFSGGGDLRLYLFVTLEVPEEEAVCEVVAHEAGATIKQLAWPGAVQSDCFEAMILPTMQGMLLPARWPQAITPDDGSPHGRGLYMSVWGHLQGDRSLAAIIETPTDAARRFAHPAGGPTRMEVLWRHSLGRLRYPRRLRFCLLSTGGYVAVAKRYRRWVQATNRFVALTEKIARYRPVELLVGAPVIHTHILYHCQPTSSYYGKLTPEQRHDLVSFHERAAHLRTLAARGVKRAYLHLDGWGFRGYDNLHPDILPPCPEAGGWAGLRHLADVCAELNILFAVHDQYRDYYLDAASYDEELAVRDEEGTTPGHSIWYGGAQKFLCPRFAPEFVKRNHLALQDHGVRLRGSYLDVFAVVPPDECYHPEHPVTRSECLGYRAACFGQIRMLEGIVSSEEPVDWAIPYLDLVHHGPYSLHPSWEQGTAKGIPVPFFNLVYHDAVILPWSPGRQAWGIPQGDDGFLHALLNAGIPYLSLNPDSEEERRVRTVCGLHQRVGLAEMTRHAFLDESGRRQQSEFADGTCVTVDFATGDFDITPPLTQSELHHAWS